MNLALLLAVLVFALGFLVGRVSAPGDGPESAKAAVESTDSEAVSPSTNTEVADPVDAAPLELRPADFKMKVKVLDKQCFGSAGCNVEYQIDPVYLGEVTDLEDLTIEITFEVTGDESGKQIGTISVDGGSYDVESRSASTRSNAVKLKSRATEVTTY